MNRQYTYLITYLKYISVWVGHISITVLRGLVEKGYFSGFIVEVVLSSDTLVFQQLYDCYITSKISKWD